MIDYHRLGQLPPKHHIQLPRSAADLAHGKTNGESSPVYYEHCLTRKGFDGGYTICYRKNNPGAEVSAKPSRLTDTFVLADEAKHALTRRHFRAGGVAGKGTLWESLRILCGNDDIRIGTSEPTVPDSGLLQDGDGDLLLFVHEGAGLLSSELGDLRFGRQDYVWIPRGLVHRIRFDAGKVHVMWMECRGGLEVPGNFRNPWGQLKMDAPYSHRDFRRPERLSEPASGDFDAHGHVRITNKRGDRFSDRVLPHHPFDVVGWDGTSYPVAFNIKDYQPKTGLVHLPPTIHTTFLGGRGQFVVCSFVPRKLDYHAKSIPCPYPHSSVDCDEVLWYVEGNFASRKGVGPASVSLHPAGIPHAPQPGRYEASFGHERTDELAVMVDTFKPLHVTVHAVGGEDPDYHGSWHANKGRAPADMTYVD